MKSRSCRTLALLLCLTEIGAHPQIKDLKASDSEVKAAHVSAVTGRVSFDDTKAPARWAHVFLQPIAALEADAPPNRSGQPDREPVTASVETQFDGSYSFTHVAPGSYYVIATFPGYISPFVQLLLAESRSPYQDWRPLGPKQKKSRDSIIRSIPRVDVQANLPASVDVSLERGAAVSGNISYDDGGPAAGLNVKLLAPMDQNGKQVWTTVELNSSFFWSTDQSTTDDRGNYRITGLSPGRYAIEVDLEFSDVKKFHSSSSSSIQSNAHSALLRIYSGSTPHTKDITDFTVQQREERTGEDIVIPATKLHSIKGNIVCARDGHVINSGSVLLMNASDQSISANQSLTEDDASFTFSFVFEGDYILTAPMSFDVDYLPAPHIGTDPGPPQFDPHRRHMYGSASMSLHVDGDIDRLTIPVPEPTAKETQFYQDVIRREQQRVAVPQ